MWQQEQWKAPQLTPHSLQQHPPQPLPDDLDLLPFGAEFFPSSWWAFSCALPQELEEEDLRRLALRGRLE